MLVIDEDPQARHALRIGLSAHDYGLSPVADSASDLDLDMAARHLPDLVVLEFDLPDTGGNDVIAGMRGGSSFGVALSNSSRQKED